MSGVAYVLTKTVRHLSSWTQDSQTTDWPKGAYRPLCGGKVRGPQATVWAGFPYDDDRLPRALDLPVCRRCLKTLDALNAIVGEQS